MTYALKYGKLRVIKYLFDRGVTVQHYYDENILLLTDTMMVKSEHEITNLKLLFDILEVLIKNGSDVNETDGDGSLLEKLFAESSLYPLEQSNLVKASWLLRMGADPNKCRKKDGYTHLYHAIFTKNYQIVDLLLGMHIFRKYHTDILDNYRNTKIPINVNKGSENADINPIMLAACMGDINVFILLSNHGADVTYITSNDLKKDNSSLLGAGANLLHCAAYYIQTNMCEYLIENGFDINVPIISTGDTPIITVIRNSNSNSRSYSLIETLIEFGGDPDKPNKLGLTPISIALRMADLALQTSEKTNKPEDIEKSSFLQEIVTLLIEYEVDIQFYLLKRLKTNKFKTIITNKLLLLRQRIYPSFSKTKSIDISTLENFEIFDFITLIDYPNIKSCLDEIDEDDKDENGTIKGTKNNKIIKLGEKLYVINARLLFNEYFSNRKKIYDNQFYACTNMLTTWPNRTQIDWKKGSLFNLKRIGMFEGFVSYNLFYGLLKSNIKLFELIEDQIRIPATTGIQMIHENRNAVSSNHCQDETGGRYYEIKEMRLNSNTPSSSPKTTPDTSYSDEPDAHKSKRTRNGGRTKGKQRFTRKQQTKKRRPAK
jgi:ankyrin repeat protein